MDKKFSLNFSEIFLLGLLGILTLVFTLIGFLAELPILGLLPLFVLFVMQTVLNFERIYYWLLFLLPFSVETEIAGGFSTDFPTEPIVGGLMFITIIYVLLNPKLIRFELLFHPITLIISFHFLWMVFASYTSSNTYHSIKFVVSKVWYFTTYILLTYLLCKNENFYKKIFWILLIPLVISILYVNINHAFYGFTFSKINFAVGPIYRNKVNYSAFMTMFYPLLVIGYFNWYKNDKIKKRFIGFCLILFLIAIWFTYTRAAYGSLFIALGAYFIIKYKLNLKAISLTILLSIVFITYLLKNNNYFAYKPRYEKAVSHKEFLDLLSATSKGQDVSTMERVYRWVAAKNMIIDKPIYGFGPGNFYFFYKPYAVQAFKTYVSDNKEKSTTHNYFLLLATEQGIPGMIIFVILIIVFLLTAERVYHQTKEPLRKSVVLACYLSNVIMFSYLLMNDMIEADKVGPLFWINIGVLIALDNLNFIEKKQQI